ncbi:GerA spore germination protein [Gracilibacillus orientalis]|uniref:GerA spore germination protein n=1 Tax=Gracilibacillus orientalis TaxID=334253 RepID=A0A1I4QH13_9BACI|nr:spore germination protein [Gracilibacillus orientalis]SFM38903.1 GerA spore germination protein [Gracilibacillus orientalis]
MGEVSKKVKKRFKNYDDFFQQETYLYKEIVEIMGFNTLINIPKTKDILQEYTKSVHTPDMTLDDFLKTIGEVKEGNIDDAIQSIFEGKLIICSNKGQYVVVDPIPKELNRSIEPPSNENVLQGSQSSFIEDLETNIGLIRKEKTSEKLCVNSYSMGKRQNKKLALLYIEGNVNKDILSEMQNQIEKNIKKELQNQQDLSNILGFSPWLTMSKFHTSELPSEAVKMLLQGRVVLFIDRLPIAFILPSLIWDMFTIENEHNYPYPLMILIRVLRVLGLLTTLIVPGLYVALVAVNPGVLRIEMALSIAQSRQGVPYPALVEVLIMLLILELILEASVRLPKSIGPTITMVGGIILGQAIVDAKLVSNLLIIILAATTIANFTIVGVQNSLSIRLYKYLIVIFASIYGVFGLLAGMLLIIAYLSSLKTFGVSYLNVNLERDVIKR